MFKLYVGGFLVQQADNILGLTLLEDNELLRASPYHSWNIVCSDKLNLTLESPNNTDEIRTITVKYHDGFTDNVFKVHGGMAMTKYPVQFPTINHDYEKKLTDQDVKDFIASFRKRVGGFGNNDYDISEYLIKNYQVNDIYAISRVCPDDFFTNWYKALKNSDRYKISDEKENEFTIQSLDGDGWYIQYNPTIIKRC